MDTQKIIDFIVACNTELKPMYSWKEEDLKKLSPEALQKVLANRIKMCSDLAKHYEMTKLIKEEQSPYISLSWTKPKQTKIYRTITLYPSDKKWDEIIKKIKSDKNVALDIFADEQRHEDGYEEWGETDPGPEEEQLNYLKIKTNVKENLVKEEEDEKGDEEETKKKKSEPAKSDSNKRYKAEIDLVVVPTSTTVDKAVEALGDVNNYGIYISNLKNTKAGLKKAMDDHFGPSVPMVKRGLEKKLGKTFPPKSKQSIDDFIKSFVKTPNILYYHVDGNKIVFPTNENPPIVNTKAIIKTVMDNAKIKYKLEDQEVMETLSEHFLKVRKFQKLIKEVLNSKEDNAAKWDKLDLKQKEEALLSVDDDNGPEYADTYANEPWNQIPEHITNLINLKILNQINEKLDLSKKTKLDKAWNLYLGNNDITPDELSKKLKITKENANKLILFCSEKKKHMFNKLNENNDSLFKIDPKLAYKIYNYLVKEVPEIKNKFATELNFFHEINKVL